MFCEPIENYSPRNSITEIPQLRWKGSIRDIMELLMVLNELKVITDESGKPVSFSYLTHIAGMYLGVELKQPFRIQNEILKRVSDKDTFLERMDAAMRSIAQKKRH